MKSIVRGLDYVKRNRGFYVLINLSSVVRTFVLFDISPVLLSIL